MRRAQTSLCAIGIHIDFHRAGHAGSRMKPRNNWIQNNWKNSLMKIPPSENTLKKFPEIMLAKKFNIDEIKTLRRKRPPEPGEFRELRRADVVGEDLFKQE